MSDRQEILERVRSFIVDILALDPDEANPDKRFFQDLGGESIELLELQFRLAKEMGVEVEFSKVFDRAQIKPDEQGIFGPDSIAKLRACFPFLPVAQLPANPRFDALLLANHGGVAYGDNVDQAFGRLETVEHLARITLVAELVGGAKVLP
ncbi:MAG: class II aldolase/adducin family protein, partial [Deltaproteobacteria bacterium]|nr:class II aldolase/adducin family protein [Deltaproteobacteria bacterium]